MAMGVVGIPGIAFAVAILAIRDYPTILQQRPDTSQRDRSVLSRAISTLAALLQTPTARYTYLGNALAFLTIAGVYTWLPSYFSRFYGLDIAGAGAKGAAIVMAGASGGIVWAYLSDKVSVESARLKLLVPAASALGAFLVFSYAFFVAVPGQSQLLSLMLGAFLLTGSGAVTYSVAMDVTHPALRSTAASVVTLTGSVIGFAGGPFIVGLLSDNIGLNAAMGCVTSIAIVAASSLAMASRTYERDRSAMESIGRIKNDE
jgi:sugar phosphate permease